MGGGTYLTDRVALVYQIESREAGLWLAGAVLVRGREPYWYRSQQADRKLAAARARPPFQGAGGGGSAGRYFIRVASLEETVWVDQDLRIPLEGSNVLLLDGADDTAHPPSIHGRLTIDPNLGEMPPAPSAPVSDEASLAFGVLHMQAHRDASRELLKRIDQLPAVREFLELPNPTYQTPVDSNVDSTAPLLVRLLAGGNRCRVHDMEVACDDLDRYLKETLGVPTSRRISIVLVADEEVSNEAAARVSSLLRGGGYQQVGLVKMGSTGGVSRISQRD